MSWVPEDCDAELGVRTPGRHKYSFVAIGRGGGRKVVSALHRDQSQQFVMTNELGEAKFWLHF